VREGRVGAPVIHTYKTKRKHTHETLIKNEYKGIK
jgi:hypothetical protein